MFKNPKVVTALIAIAAIAVTFRIASVRKIVVGQ